MKERFKSILLELKTSLLNPNVKKELKNDEDKEQHEKLLEFVDKYYKNIDLFEKEEEHVQKLLLKNAEELLSNTSATYFNNYYPQYLRNALFLLNNYYKSENINSKNINVKSISQKLNEFLLKLSNEKKNTNIKSENYSLEKEEFNLLIKELENKNLIEGQWFLSGEYLFKGLTFEGIRYLEKLNIQNTDNNTDTISKSEFEKRYMKLVSLLNFEDIESNLVLYTKKEKRPFKLYKNSNNSIFIKAGLETKNMSLPLDKCISIIYNNGPTPFKSYTDVLFPKISDNSIFDEIKDDNFIISDSSLIGDEIIIDDKLESTENNIGKNVTNKIFDKYTNPVLNIKSVSKVFSKYIIKYNAEYTSTIIGIFAKWGRGKTFFYEQLKEDIEKENTHIYFCKFQPWKYQQQESAWAYLYEKILNNYIENKKTPFSKKISNCELYIKEKFNRKCWIDKIVNGLIDFIAPDKLWKIFLLNKTRLGLGKLIIGLSSILCLFIWIILPIDWKFNAVSWIIGVLGLTGTIFVYKSYSFYMKSKGTVSDLINHYGKTNDYSNYLGFQNEIEKELKYLINTYITKDDERLILFIDDLDRCDEKMIINIMDNLRLVLEDNEINKKLTIITAIDERILLKSIKYKYFNKNNNSRFSKIKAKEYIEKFFLIALKLNHLNNKDKIEIVNEYTSIFNSKKELTTSKNTRKEINNNILNEEIVIKNESTVEEVESIPKIENEEPEKYEELEVIEELEVLSIDEIKFIKELILKYNIDTPRKINIMIQRYLLFKNFIFEELGYENTNYELYISLIFFILKEKNLKKLIKLYNDSENNIIEIEIDEQKFKEDKDRFIILVKYAEMVSPF